MEEESEPFRQGLVYMQESAVFNTLSAEASIALGIMLLLIFFSALISGSETAFFSIVPEKFHYKKGKKTIDKTVLALLDQPKKLLATILIANNFINVGIVILGTFITQELFFISGNPVLTFLIQIVVLTALLLLFGEIMPKVYAAHASYTFARFMAAPLMILRKIFSPLSSLLVYSTSSIDKRMKANIHQVTMADVNNAIELTRNDEPSENETEEQKILKGIARFGDIEVKEIMKSRVDVIAIEESESYTNVLKIINESGYSRIPVYRDSFDNIQGVIYIKDFLGSLDKKDDFKWNSYIRPAFFVPENKKISDLLLEFQEKKIHLAIVVDEYGGTSGIITMEDVIEEIVGEIIDEFDPEENHFIFKKLGEGEYLFEGKVLLNDFCKAMQVDNHIFEDVRGEADTLAGFLLEKLGHIPEKGTEVKHEMFTFIVQNVSDRRITRIIVKVHE
ncbi:MAG: gliding motility-associated protein GldE [Bacteroidales bacterium]